MKNILSGSLLILFLLLYAPPESLAQTTLFGGVGRGPGADRGEVIRIDQATAEGTHVGPGADDPQAGLTGLAFDSAGRLYASTINAFVFGESPTSTLILIDPVTGEQTQL